MAFSQATIDEVYPPRFRDGQLYLRWRSSSPAGTWFQIYVGRRLAWWGQDRAAEFPAPPGARNRIEIGTVAATEFDTDFAGSMVAAPAPRARLEWTGGTYLDAGNPIQGYRIYGEESPGAGVNYATPLANVVAYEGGLLNDGFGLGGFGDGGFGYAASYYRWTSTELAAGSWTFAVVPVDAAGNEGTGSTVSVPVIVPPMPPARNSEGRRLTYTYDLASKKVTLNWLASPG